MRKKDGNWLLCIDYKLNALNADAHEKLAFVTRLGLWSDFCIGYIHEAAWSAANVSDSELGFFYKSGARVLLCLSYSPDLMK